MQNHFLLELGTEELPPKLLRNLSAQLLNNLTAQLKQHHLDYNDIQSFATPRRLAVLVSGLPDKQADNLIEKKGPSIQAPKQAIMGFAKSVGVSDISTLIQKKIGKTSYYFYQTQVLGQQTPQLLSQIIPLAISHISHNRMMRWGLGKHSFIRPVHWLLALWNKAIIPSCVFDLNSGRQTQGLRFVQNNNLNIEQASDYEKQMQSLFIEPSFDKRRADIVVQIKQLEQKINKNIIIDEALLNEVCALVEAPKVFIGQFDEEFLAIPKEVLILAMESHQKYFPVFDKQEKLQANFVAVANLTHKNQALDKVITGNQRVIRPRLSDAQFFWQQDLKISLESRLDQLKAVIFMQGLGSVYHRALRLEHLMALLAQKQNKTNITDITNVTLAKRAGLLAKSDLVSSMVVEFPKLQGIMGRYYAQNDKEDEQVSQAIGEQYLPGFSGDKIPQSLLGALLSIADKIDTIAGIFAIDKIPTGSKDPYALRRLAVGLSRIIIESKLTINLYNLIKNALASHQIATAIPENTQDLMIQFMMDRLKAYYLEQGIQAAVFNAVSLGDTGCLLDFDTKIKALMVFSQQAEAQSLITLNKRILNTLKDTHSTQLTIINSALFEIEIERILFAQLEKINSKTQQNYQEKILDLCGLETNIALFFEQVMVNVNDNAIKKNRLSLLNNIKTLFLSVADLSKL